VLQLLKDATVLIELWMRQNGGSAASP
jgi:hypothetical protein